MIQSYRSYLWSSPPKGRLALLVTTLIVIGSVVPYADLVVAPLLIYAGLQIRAQRDAERPIRLIGQAAAGVGLVMAVLAVWSLLSLAELFVPMSLGG